MSVLFITSRVVLSFGLLTAFVALPAAARAQDEKPEELKQKEAEKRANALLLRKAEEEYRIFFKRPEKVFEFWAAIKFEIEVGKFDLAALHLKQLLAKQPPEDVDKDLFKIEEVQGMSAFLRLQ